MKSLPAAAIDTPVSTRLAPDRRRHKRVALTIPGRFMREDRAEYDCMLEDICVGGASLKSSTQVEFGERLVVCLEHLGTLQAEVVRIFEGGFGVKFNTTQRKREKIAAELTWLINRDLLEGEQQRRHARRQPTDGNARMILSEGIAVNCRIVDISLSGASVETEARPELGSTIVLGQVSATVRRHHKTGIAVTFADPMARTNPTGQANS